MSLIDEASLVQIPSGYKEDKLYSIIPSDGSGDFNFSRASTATRVNAEGLIEEMPYNLLQQSNTFNTTWASVNSGSVTGGQSGYDGSSNAWLLTKAATNFSGIRQSVSVNGVHTFSIIAKAGSLNFLWLEEYIGASIYFDLINGTTSGSGAISSYMTSLGGGWWRCELVSDNSITIASLYPQATGSPSSTSGNIYIQDAQLVSGSTAKPYFPTTDRLNVPRIDYTGGGCGKLLLEPQRTNLVTQSEAFDNAAWTKTKVSVTANNTISPDGTQNADKVINDNGSTASDIRVLSQNVTIGTTYVLSVFVKAAGFDNFNIDFSNSRFGDANTTFDLSNGTIIESGISNDGQGIENYGNGWFRCYVIATAVNSGNSGLIFRLSENSQVGDGTKGFYLYGAQLEQGSYPTSYIPTSGATATRIADVCNGAGDANTFNDSEGVLFADISALANDGTNRFVSISDGSTNNRVTLKFDNIDNRLEFFVFSGGSASYSFIVVIPNTTINNKIAIKYKANDFSVYINGIEMNASASGIVPTGLSELSFDQGDGANPFYGNVKQLQYYGTALTDSDLETLTSWTSFNEMAEALQYTTY